MPCLWCEVDAFGSFLQKECVNKSFLEFSSYKSRRWNCSCAIFKFSYQTCSKMFVLFVSVYFVFSRFLANQQNLSAIYRNLLLVALWCRWKKCYANYAVSEQNIMEQLTVVVVNLFKESNSVSSPQSKTMLLRSHIQLRKQQKKILMLAKQGCQCL